MKDLEIQCSCGDIQKFSGLLTDKCRSCSKVFIISFDEYKHHERYNKKCSKCGLNIIPYTKLCSNYENCN